MSGANSAPTDKGEGLGEGMGTGAQATTCVLDAQLGVTKEVLFRFFLFLTFFVFKGPAGPWLSQTDW